MFSPCRCAPKMCTGSPSAEARSWLSPVRMQQEKPRALEIPAERAARPRLGLALRDSLVHRLCRLGEPDGDPTAPIDAFDFALLVAHRINAVVHRVEGLDQ